MKQFILTPAMGKRLIGKATAAHPAVQAAGDLIKSIRDEPPFRL